jgi:protein-S-isoprenylcysteine O-methyltransferase Ste14
MSTSTTPSAATAAVPDTANVIIFPPLLYAITLALGLTLSYVFPFHFLPTPLALAGGAALILAGMAILVAGVRMLGKYRTTINPSGATTTIVQEGIFRFTRNPMYISFTLLSMGIAFLFNAVWSLLLLVPLIIIVQKGIIEREEQYLTRKFGDEYVRYKSHVRRWL